MRAQLLSDGPQPIVAVIAGWYVGAANGAHKPQAAAFGIETLGPGKRSVPAHRLNGAPRHEARHKGYEPRIGVVGEHHAQPMHRLPATGHVDVGRGVHDSTMAESRFAISWSRSEAACW